MVKMMFMMVDLFDGLVVNLESIRVLIGFTLIKTTQLADRFWVEAERATRTEQARRSERQLQHGVCVCHRWCSLERRSSTHLEP